MLEPFIVAIPLIFGGILFAFVLVLDPHDISLSDVGTPETLEARGYTIDSIDIMIETEIDELVRAAATFHDAKRVKVGALQTGLENLSEVMGVAHAVEATQQFLGLTGFLVEVNFTIDEAENLGVTVYVHDPHTLEPLSVTRLTHESQKPEELIKLAARNIVKITQPYIYASYLFEEGQRAYALGQDGSDLMDEAITWIDGKLLDESLEDLEEFYNLRGLIALEQGQYDIAIRNFRLATNHEPDFSFPYVNWGRLWLELDYPERAERYFDLAREFGDEHIPIVDVYRARAKLSKGKLERALDIVNEGVEEAPDLAELYQIRAEALDQLGDEEGAAVARRDMAIALTLRPQQVIFDPY